MANPPIDFSGMGWLGIGGFNFQMTDIIYTAEPTPARFHRSNSTYRGIMGPRGSGKSTACCMEIMRRAQEQEKSPLDGYRYSKWGVIRNTYRELLDTTVATWLTWFSEDNFGDFNKHDMTHKIEFNDVRLEVIFRALDRPGDVKKLLSLELTGVYVNEAREIWKGIIDHLKDCLNRYPPPMHSGATWSGVIMDTNPPDTDHWWYKLAEEVHPKDWKFFRQPGGLIKKGEDYVPNPKAENIHNLTKGYDYYLTAIEGQNKDHIEVYYCSEYGFVKEGKPVIPEYVDSVHCSEEDLKPVPDRTIFVGIDFGLTPAAVFGQRMVSGRWMWFDELVTEDMGAVRFAELLNTKILHEYKGFEFEFYGDPSGDERAPTDERTPFQILKANGIPAVPAPTNDPVIRREAIAVPFGKMVEGKPLLMISPKCRITRKGLQGGYCYKRKQISTKEGSEQYHDKPDKNKYSHPVEAGGYMMVGAGEGAMIIKIPGKSKIHTPRRRGPVQAQGWMVG